MSVRTEGDAPVRKVAAGGIAGATTVIVIWLAQALLGKTIPAEVASAITTLLAFAVSYLTPPGENDRIEQVQAPRIA